MRDHGQAIGVTDSAEQLARTLARGFRSGSVSLVKNGGGTMILSGAVVNSHTGAVPVNGGLLRRQQTDANAVNGTIFQP